MKNILDLTNQEAKEFFLAEERYFTFDLPKYFSFNKILKKLAEKLEDKNLSDFYSEYKTTNQSGTEETKKHNPAFFEDVNYKLFNNKDGEYSWRLFQLVHPVLYVSLIHEITKEENWNIILESLRENTKIECASIPIVKSEKQKTEKGGQILTWWKEVEQKSISLSLEYDYIFHTDIVDCYGSIYTHSISWALHTKPIAKQKRNDEKFVGVAIDKYLQRMANGQTNGIPQGSILMDFIAEIVLKYADKELSKKLINLQDNNFKIIRYRDDYRIFVNNPETGKQIIKELSNVLSDLGMRISSEKTIFSNDVINSSIKADKLFWLTNSSKNWNIEKHLLIIKKLSEKYKNSGTLEKELQNFYKKIYNRKKLKNINVLISIITDIAFKNPRTYPISISILGKFISTIDENGEAKKEYISKVENKIKKLPNTEIVDLWLQRFTLKFDKDKEFQGNLSKKITDKSQEIWNSDWLNDDLKKILKETEIINQMEIEKMDEYPKLEEISLFESKTNYYH
jgi:hypothetical protein